MPPPLPHAPILVAKTAATAAPIWFDGHEGLGVWVGSLASVIVAAVALGLPFLMRWLDGDARRRNGAATSITAAHHARYALGLIVHFQEECWAIVQNPLNKSGRQWAFELQIARRTLESAQTLEIGDPGLRRLMIAAQAWMEQAETLVPLPADEALFQLQYSTGARQAADAELLHHLRHFMLRFGTPLVPWLDRLLSLFRRRAPD